MSFLAGLMAITYFGLALPILFLAAIGTCLLSVASYKDDVFAWKTIFGIFCFSAIFWMTDFDWRSIISWMILVYTAAWLLTGSVWFLFKWNKFVGSARADADKHLKEALRKEPDMPPAQKNAIMLSHRPSLDENKERALSWVIFWPFSILAYILGDLLHDLAEWIVERLRGMATLITRRHFGEFENNTEGTVAQ